MEKPSEEIRGKLIALINDLINKDFSALLQLLYRVDVDEKKIRLYLNENTNEDSASVLADLIIERQLQKIESRKLFRESGNSKSEEERW
ncbi:MAG: hypothetical protein Q8891_11225 [Bacteroidota bacterium]|nr:hypothetical protein [Bacteroidota bacterium]